MAARQEYSVIRRSNEVSITLDMLTKRTLQPHTSLFATSCFLCLFSRQVGLFVALLKRESESGSQTENMCPLEYPFVCPASSMENTPRTVHISQPVLAAVTFLTPPLTPRFNIPFQKPRLSLFKAVLLKPARFHGSKKLSRKIIHFELELNLALLDFSQKRGKATP